ncbi:MAG: epoxyqueuosine reductase [Candidatus Lokiarchaeota archaeon]|nr:epoxyqueuosine reductase [Candidatus Lokiarchaeota archaeon]
MSLKHIIFNKLNTENFQVQIVSANHIKKLEEEIRKLYEHSLINNKIYDFYLKEDHDFSLLNNYPEIKSLIIVASPCYQTKLIFYHKETEYSILLPSNLYMEEKSRRKARTILKRMLEFNGYKIKDAFLPEKLIAVHSGLGLYGKNNLCYINGIGSFHSLALFCSDFECDNDSWQEIDHLKTCGSCKACLKACPTQAIDEKRFILHAEKCLAFFNENQGMFPEWIDPSSHTCLVGCLKCQLVCPHNRAYINQYDNKVLFSQEETTLLLDGTPLDKLPLQLFEKVKNYGLEKYHVSLSRNLMAVINAIEIKNK